MSNEEKENKKSLFSGKIFQKFKQIKHIEIIIALVLGAIILVIYLSSMSSSSTNKSKTTTSLTVSEYSSMLENKLESVLIQIDGVTSVSAMITLKSSAEVVYATSTEEKSNTNTTTNGSVTNITRTTEPIKASSSALVTKEILPEISGVIIVAGGASNTKVKLEILKAVQAILDVPTSNIEILVGK